MYFFKKLYFKKQLLLYSMVELLVNFQVVTYVYILESW
jgi:hypothetical protein